MLPKLSHPIFWLCGFLLFWFELISSCCCGGTSWVVPRKSSWRDVGVGGMSVRKHVAESNSAVYIAITPLSML